DRIQRGDGRGIPQVRVVQVDDDMLWILRIVELRVQVVGGGEEQLAIDHVLGDFFVKVLFDAAFHGDQVGHPIGEEHHGGQYAGGHADGQIVRGHGEDHGNEHDSGFALG